MILIASSNDNIMIKPVVGYEDFYCVTEYGDVYSLPRLRHLPVSGMYLSKKKILRNSVCRLGYSKHLLTNDTSERKEIKTHRIVAMAFIPNPEDKPCVNHKDGNKLNNHVSNLEWCTHKENVKHMWDTGLNSREKIMSAVKASVESRAKKKLNGINSSK